MLRQRLTRVSETEKMLTRGEMSLADFASGHEYFGLHFRNNEWVFREWAPHASEIHIVGDMTDWRCQKRFAPERIRDKGGIWEIRLPSDALTHTDLYKLRIRWPGGEGERIPAYARRVVQDSDTKLFSAQVC